MGVNTTGTVGAGPLVLDCSVLAPSLASAKSPSFDVCFSIPRRSILCQCAWAAQGFRTCSRVEVRAPSESFFKFPASVISQGGLQDVQWPFMFQLVLRQPAKPQTELSAVE